MTFPFRVDALRPRRRFRDERFDSRPSSDCEEGGFGASGEVAGGAGGIGQDARRDLLQRIGSFLIVNDLEITNANLGFANAALSGRNERLAQKLVAREISGKAISQQWIDKTLRLDESLTDQLRDIDALMDSFEALMGRFARTAESACEATANYSDVLGQQVTEVEQMEQGGDATALIQISREMLERMHQIDSSMKESRAETEELCESLARARREAELDHLTGLPNRRAFERRFTDASAVAREAGEALSVAFCDIDHFKKVNDTHGHEAGDRVLRAVSDILREAASSDCFVARHGGEEFALLFRGSAKEDAWSKLEGVRRILARRRFRNRETDQSFGQITFSAGIAEIGDAEDPRSALARADEALYRAKGEGRNRVLIA